MSKYRRKKQQLLTAFDELFHTFSPSDKINVVKISNARKDVNTMKTIIRSQMFEVKKAQDELEIKRKLLSDVMIERKTHEKLKEKAFEDFQKELKATEAKEIDELVSFTYNN